MTVAVTAEPLTPTQARELTQQINDCAASLWELIRAAFEGGAWYSLGYQSWDDYREAELSATQMIALPTEERREAVRSLRDAGMSQRQVADSLNVSRMTVNRDERSNSVTDVTVDDLEILHLENTACNIPPPREARYEILEKIEEAELLYLEVMRTAPGLNTEESEALTRSVTRVIETLNPNALIHD